MGAANYSMQSDILKIFPKIKNYYPFLLFLPSIKINYNK